MAESEETRSRVIPYGTARHRRRRVAFAVAVVPLVYLGLYVVLRLCGIYYPFYNQGGWEIEGATGSSVVDAGFTPAMIVEGIVQSGLRVLPEPGGG